MPRLHLWFMVTLVALFSGAGVFSLLLNAEPATKNAPLSLLLLLGLCITALFTALALGFQPQAPVVRVIRRALLLAISIGLLLYLSALQLLTVWNAAPLLLALLMIEGYATVRKLPSRGGR